jgi:predicted nucleic-acid-binding protein
VIGLDTNVIVRYLAQDDARQAAVATRLIEGSLTAEARGFISIVTLAEVVWVMASNYRATRVAVARASGLRSAAVKAIASRVINFARAGGLPTGRAWTNILR